MPAATLDFDTALIERFDGPGPRYTSYPTADRFTEAFDEAAYRRAAASRNAGVSRRPLALYVHLPFCRDVCFYCACNRIVTRDARKASDYLEYLELETAMAAALFGKDPRVVRMHWGGGTPTYYDADRLRALFAWIARRFELAHDGEYSIEVDPRTVSDETIETLRAIGFNRISFGVQDFDPAVQAAVHRVQSTGSTLSAIEAARRCRFGSINIDLIYGLPLQTPASFERTLDLVVRARPGRIALYNYAHLPERFKAQRRIRREDLPTAPARLDIQGLAVQRLGAAGYQYIGMDHFALPDDALAVAQRRGQLRRDFQGYSAGLRCDMVGIGVSAVGAVGATYSQNQRDLKDYYACLQRGGLPIMRGMQLGADDLARRAVIEGLMCHFALSKAAIETAYLIDFDRYFAAELRALREFEDLGLVWCGDDRITVAPKGRFVIRAICMVFDRYLRRDDAGGPRFSRVI